jgi:GNAT superfamily N-acetyltransferase
MGGHVIERGSTRYRQRVIDVREATADDLAWLPELEARSDTLFASLGIGPLPGPGSVDALSKALVVLVSGEPPQGFARIELLAGLPHLEQLSVDLDHMGQGIGRALLRAACDWVRQAGYREMTLATYRDVAWNAPFYRSEGFIEAGGVDEWYVAHGLEPEESVMGQFGVRVLMRRLV